MLPPFIGTGRTGHPRIWPLPRRERERTQHDTGAILDKFGCRYRSDHAHLSPHVASKQTYGVYKVQWLSAISHEHLFRTHSQTSSILFVVQPTVMPSVQTRPRGPTVRFVQVFFHRYGADAKNKTRTFVEGFHFGPLWSRRKVVRFDTDVPSNESPGNLRYVNLKNKYTRSSTSRQIHESRVHIGQDMFLVSGYWDPRADVNRSFFTLTKTIWRGELSVVCAGRYIAYRKRMRSVHKADLAVKRSVSFTIPLVLTLTTFGRFVQVFKQQKTIKKLVPRTILQ